VERFNDGVISVRAFTRHAHDNAFFFDRLLVFIYDVPLTFISYEYVCFLPIKKHLQRFFSLKVSVSFYIVSDF